MNVSIVTLFPDLYRPFLEASLIGRARKAGVVAADTVDLFSFVEPEKVKKAAAPKKQDAPKEAPAAEAEAAPAPEETK